MMYSMTGFAAAKGAGAGFSWVWDLRSVNSKGLDLRIRVPDWVEGLEFALRAELAKRLQRGNINLTLKITRDAGAGNLDAFRINDAYLSHILTALCTVENAAMAVGVTLGQATSADVLAIRGVTEQVAEETDTLELKQILLAEVPGLIDAFQSSRALEGTALASIITAQLARIETLVLDAGHEADARLPLAATTLRESVDRLIGQIDSLDPTRLAQELALLAVKTDVTEELDRLTAHTSGARALLSEGGSVGRKFDFLMQEFMREANTLCSKAQSLGLTRIGLDLKAVIDQMREQVQNVE